MNILIIKLSAIGDVVQTLPALEAIKKTYPDSEITWVVEEAAAGILEGHPAVNRLLISRRKAWFSMLGSVATFAQGIRGILAFFRELRDRRYDMAIDLQGLLKSGIIIGLARADRKIGFDRTRELSYLFLNERLPAYDREKHALERYLDVARYLGASDALPICTLPIEREISVVKERLGGIVRNSEFGVRSGKKEQGDAGTGVQGTEVRGDTKQAIPLLVVINPIARWKTKLWPEQRFAALADRMVEEKGAVIIFTGGRADREAASRIIGMMKHGAANWAGETSLKELAALAAEADLFITTDTGPMHLAAAAGARVIALFGPTAPWRTGPYGKDHAVVRTGAECSPCFQRTCSEKMKCMEGISVDDVMMTIQKMMHSQEVNLSHEATKTRREAY